MIIAIPAVIKECLRKILGPDPKFKKGDSVQCASGDDLMVVQWVRVLRHAQVVYLCRWYDTQAGLHEPIFSKKPSWRLLIGMRNTNEQWGLDYHVVTTLISGFPLPLHPGY